MDDLVWTDSHCHLPSDPAEAAALIAEAARSGVRRIVDVGTDRQTSLAASRRAAEHPGAVFATVGLHPHDASSAGEGTTLDLDWMVGLLGAPGIVAVGECGLDYHYDHSPRDRQRQVFAAQIDLARREGLALVIHTRAAWNDTIDILEAEGPPDRTVFHCFSGGPGEARRCLDLGAWLSFSGIVTFPSAPEVREAASLCPRSRLLVETDSPYLAPVPHRGRPNRPALVAVVGAAVAAARGAAPADVATATVENAATVFGIGPGES